MLDENKDREKNITRDLLLVGHIPGLPREGLIGALASAEGREWPEERRDVVGVAAGGGGDRLVIATGERRAALAGFVAERFGKCRWLGHDESVCKKLTGRCTVHRGLWVPFILF